jgi:hypothetical protein
MIIIRIRIRIRIRSSMMMIMIQLRRIGRRQCVNRSSRSRCASTIE